MKNLFYLFILPLIVTVVLAWPFTVWGASLVCDPQAGVMEYNVEIDGVVTNNYPAEPDGSVSYNVDSLVQGPHIFRLQAIGTGGWPSDWSSPFDATKPGMPFGARILP